VGKNLLNDEQLQLIAAAAAQGAAQMLIDAGAVAFGDDGEPPSLIEMWAGHFVDHHLRQDYVVDSYLSRNDTSTALFEKQLEHLLSKTYDKRYPALKARQFVPEGPGIPNGAETVSSIGYDIMGEATILSSYGEDVRRVEIDGKKSTWNIVGIAAAWALTIQQARAAAMAGVDIDSKGLMAAARIIARKMDDLIAFGDSALGLDGFLTLTTGSSGVNILNKSGTLTGDWLTATVANILADLDLMFAQFEGASIWTPTDLLLPTTAYTRFRSLKVDTGTRYTLLQWIEDQYEVKVDKWNRLNTADSAGTAGRAVLYTRDEEVVSSIVSQEAEQLPSVWKGVGWETIYHARGGGVRVENAKGICYGDYSA